MTNDEIWDSLVDHETIIIKEFGGLPWNLFFKKKPDFSKNGMVFNCKFEARRGFPGVRNGRQIYTPKFILTIDDVELENPYSMDAKDKIYYYPDDGEKLTIFRGAIKDYLQEKKTLILPYWFKELNDENTKECIYEDDYYYYPSASKAFSTLMEFLQDDFTTTDHEAIVEGYKAISLEMIPREEDDPFFSFFVSQKVLKKADEGHYTLLHNITPEEFKFLSSEAKSNGYIGYELKGPDLWGKIYKDEKEKTFYSKATWGKTPKAITKEGGKYKPKFLKEIFDKERG